MYASCALSVRIVSILELAGPAPVMLRHHPTGYRPGPDPLGGTWGTPWPPPTTAGWAARDPGRHWLTRRSPFGDAELLWGARGDPGLDPKVR